MIKLYTVQVKFPNSNSIYDYATDITGVAKGILTILHRPI